MQSDLSKDDHLTLITLMFNITKEHNFAIVCV